MATEFDLPKAMAFYHDEGLVRTYQLASRYAGPEGRIGTMLDLVDARLGTFPKEELGYINRTDPTPWDQYYTTNTAEYMGFTKGGTKAVIVAHGIGPMATIDGALAAYSWEYKDKVERRRRGGRISAEEFLRLENGDYGDVTVIDYESYVAPREYPFMSYLLASQAAEDPMLCARLGPRAQEYIALHRQLSLRYHAENGRKDIEDPYILCMKDASNCGYAYHTLEDGMAFGFLVSVGIPMNVSHQSKYRTESWAYDVGLHEWHDGTRLIGVRSPGITGIDKGPDPHRLLRRRWKDLLEPTGLEECPQGFFALVQLPDKTWFTQVEKAGEGMDTYQPEFLVTSIEPLGKPVEFSTDVHHYHGFFKYAKLEAKAVMPPEANAYALVGDPWNVYVDGDPKRQSCLAQPYRITIDHTKRLMREKNLATDYERMMQLLAA